MPDHRHDCAALSQRLLTLPNPGSVLVGFDGFVDHIIDVVGTRHRADAYDRVPTISALANRLAAAAGHSANLELVITRSKVGGNGPIMADAMAAQGTPTTCVGLLGSPQIHEVFAPMRERGTRLLSLGSPAVTDALEFSDGKLMLGKLEPLAGISVKGITTAFGGADGLAAALRQPAMIATVNWTMSLAMTDIWQHLSSEVLPGLRPDRPRWFVDLADPAKRPVTELRQGLAALAGIQAHADVILGLNGAEVRQVADAMGLGLGPINDSQAAQEACVALQQCLGLHMIMVHLTGSAACAWGKSSVSAPGSAHVPGAAQAQGFATATPRITTGAGDHFNAGFCAGLLSGLNPSEALLLGGATSGTYVRDAVSPDRARLSAFLAAWARDGVA